MSAAATPRPQPQAAAAAATDPWKHIGDLPCQLEVRVPIHKLSIGDVLALETTTVVGSQWKLSQAVPLLANGQQIAWAEFDVVDNRLAVRITRFA